MFRRLLPYGLINEENPIFQQEWRRVRWLSSPRRLRRYNLLILGGLPAASAGWWLVERANIGWGNVPAEMKQNLVFGLLGASLIMMIIASVYAVLQTTTHLHRQFAVGRWEALKLTAQYQSEILMTADAVNQLLIWPLIAMEVALRSATLLIFCLSGIYDFLQSYGKTSAYSNQFSFSMVCWSFWGLLLMIGGGYVVEPILRGRVIVAFSTVITMRVSSLQMAILAGLEGVVTLFLMQALLIGSAIYFVDRFSLVRGSMAMLFCLIPFSILPLVTLYAVYLYIRDKALKFAYQWAFEG